MDKDKLIEKIIDQIELTNQHGWMKLAKQNISNLIDEYLTSLTASVDGKECEECAAKQNRIEEIKYELEAAVEEIKDYRDQLKDCKDELRDSRRY